MFIFEWKSKKKNTKQVIWMYISGTAYTGVLMSILFSAGGKSTHGGF